TAVRGTTMTGMAYIDVLFDSTADLERGRAAIVERIPGLKLPSTVRLEIGPALAAHPANLAALEALPVPPTGAPLRDLARVRLTDDLPNGVADLGGGDPAVGGIVIARRDANLPALIERVRATLAHGRLLLPAQVQLITAYDRLDVAD